MRSQIVWTDSKFCDYVEVVQEFPDGQPENVTHRLRFVVQRRNSYPIKRENIIILQLLEDAGIEVKVEVNGKSITLAEFELHGVYTTRESKTVSSVQGMYNMRSELVRLERLARALDPQSTQYKNCVSRIQVVRTMLGTIEPEPSQTALEQSADNLLKLKEMMEREQQPDTQNTDQNPPKAASEGD